MFLEHWDKAKHSDNLFVPIIILPDDFFRKNLITFRFFLWIATTLSEQNEKIHAEMNNFWEIVKELFKDKTHHRECTICFYERPAIVSKCGHHLCIQCLAKLRICPFCRSPIDPTELRTLKDARKMGIPVFD
jgi:hypothetical protein